MLAEAWRGTSAHRRVTAAFDAVDPADAEAAALVAEELFHDQSWIAPLLRPLIDALAEEPWIQPPLRVARDPARLGVQLLGTSAGTLTATVIAGRALATAPPPATLVCSGRVLVTRYHRAAGWRLERWRVGGDDRLVADTPLPLSDETVVQLDGRTRAHLLVPDGIARAATVVTLTFTARAATNAREYAREGGALVRLGDATEAESRTRMLLTLLRLAERRDAAACFERATHAPAFGLRWAAMREWLALDVAAAAPRLAQMANDPHPEVRAAAAATLPQVEAYLCRA